MLAEKGVSAEVFLHCLSSMDEDAYLDVVNERVRRKLCGFALCDRRLKTFDKFIAKCWTITEAIKKCFCSTVCYKTNVRVEAQIVSNSDTTFGRNITPTTNATAFREDGVGELCGLFEKLQVSPVTVRGVKEDNFLVPRFIRATSSAMSCDNAMCFVSDQIAYNVTNVSTSDVDYMDVDSDEDLYLNSIDMEITYSAAENSGNVVDLTVSAMEVDESMAPGNIVTIGSVASYDLFTPMNFDITRTVCQNLPDMETGNSQNISHLGVVPTIVPGTVVATTPTEPCDRLTYMDFEYLHADARSENCGAIPSRIFRESCEDSYLNFCDAGTMYYTAENSRIVTDLRVEQGEGEILDDSYDEPHLIHCDTETTPQDIAVVAVDPMETAEILVPGTTVTRDTDNSCDSLIYTNLDHQHTRCEDDGATHLRDIPGAENLDDSYEELHFHLTDRNTVCDPVDNSQRITDLTDDAMEVSETFMPGNVVAAGSTTSGDRFIYMDFDDQRTDPRREDDEATHLRGIHEGEILDVSHEELLLDLSDNETAENSQNVADLRAHTVEAGETTNTARDSAESCDRLNYVDLDNQRTGTRCEDGNGTDSCKFGGDETIGGLYDNLYLDIFGIEHNYGMPSTSKNDLKVAGVIPIAHASNEDDDVRDVDEDNESVVGSTVSPNQFSEEDSDDENDAENEVEGLNRRIAIFGRISQRGSEKLDAKRRLSDNEGSSSKSNLQERVQLNLSAAEDESDADESTKHMGSNKLRKVAENDSSVNVHEDLNSSLSDDTHDVCSTVNDSTKNVEIRKRKLREDTGKCNNMRQNEDPSKYDNMTNSVVDEGEHLSKNVRLAESTNKFDSTHNSEDGSNGAIDTNEEVRTRNNKRILTAFRRTHHKGSEKLNTVARCLGDNQGSSNKTDAQERLNLSASQQTQAANDGTKNFEVVKRKRNADSNVHTKRKNMSNNDDVTDSASGSDTTDDTEEDSSEEVDVDKVIKRRNRRFVCPHRRTRKFGKNN